MGLERGKGGWVGRHTKGRMGETEWGRTTLLFLLPRPRHTGIDADELPAVVMYVRENWYE